mmetsp:Transcript_3343/g.15206  ORF Transcript_3343/g.15206 Transcript_3343/m.15206 type:complete len:204 (+) Transcript_3343:3025-3636(+)
MRSESSFQSFFLRAFSASFMHFSLKSARSFCARCSRSSAVCCFSAAWRANSWSTLRFRSAASNFIFHSSCSTWAFCRRARFAAISLSTSSRSAWFRAILSSNSRFRLDCSQGFSLSTLSSASVLDRPFCSWSLSSFISSCSLSASSSVFFARHRSSACAFSSASTCRFRDTNPLDPPLPALPWDPPYSDPALDCTLERVIGGE